MQMDNRSYTPMTIGNWLITFIVLALPLVGIIMQFVWAFSGDTHPSKRTFCQASLIMLGAMIVLAIGLVVVFGGLAAIMGAQQHGTPTLE